MENTCGDCLLRKTDRLSYLPDSVLHHILSFLETKYAVQTSVLSRRWRCAWKYVPAINIRSESFVDYTSFKIYVDKVLSLRYPLSLRKITFIDGGGSQDRKASLLARVVECGFSHDAKHLVIDLQTDESSENGPDYSLSELFDTTKACNFETLELNTFIFDAGFQSVGFRMLTKLELFECKFVSVHKEFVDSFSGFPCLEHLVLNGLSYAKLFLDQRFRISGLRLRSLSIKDTDFDILEIHAPKLEYFYFYNWMDLVEFTELNLPSLDHAVISIFCQFQFQRVETEDGKHCLMSLLRGLGNVTNLVLCDPTCEVLCCISEFLKQQPSPFTRLETLSCERTDGRDDAMIDYFVKGSSGTKRQVRIERRETYLDS